MVGDRILSGIWFETMEGSVFMAVTCDPIAGWRILNHLEGIQESNESELLDELIFLGQLACLGSEEAMDGILELVGNILRPGDSSYPLQCDVLAMWDRIPVCSGVRVFLSLELRRAMYAGDREFSDKLDSRLDDFDRAGGRVFAC